MSDSLRSAPGPTQAASRLDVAFSHRVGHEGWLVMSLGLQGADGRWQRDSADIFFDSCPMAALFAWMEALAVGAPRRAGRRHPPSLWTGFHPQWRGAGMAVAWDDEHEGVCLIHTRGRLLFKSTGHRGWWRLRMSARDVAVIFYRALRQFAASTYDPYRYEQLRTLRDVLACHLAPGVTQTGALLDLARLPLDDAVEAIKQRWEHDIAGRAKPVVPKPAARADVTPPDLWIRCLLHDWPRARRRARMRMLHRLMQTPIWHYGSQTQLRTLRSRALERCLASPGSG